MPTGSYSIPRLARCTHGSALLALWLAAAPCRASEEPPAGTVALRFAWPAGLRGERRDEREDGGELLGTRLRGRERIEVSRRGEQTVVSAVNAAVKNPGPGLSVVVGPDGAFVGVDGTDAARKEIGRAVRKQLPAFVGRDLREQMVDGYVRLAIAQQRDAWRDAVERWRGKELVLGQTYQAVETPPADPDRAPPRPERVAWGARRRVACPGDDGGERCVELWARGETDPEALERECHPAAVALQRLEAPARERWTLEVVADPATLVPYHLTRRWSSEAGCGRHEVQGATDDWEITWRWRR